MERPFEVLSREEPDEDLASLAASSGASSSSPARGTSRSQRIETALEIAEALVATRDLLPGPEHEGDHLRRARTAA